MKKFTACFLAMVIFFLAMFTGCGTAGSEQTQSSQEQEAGKVTIKFINGFTGGDGAFMKKITDDFNASQDKYFVQEFQEKDHYTKLKSDSYDMFVLHGDLIYTYVEDGLVADAQEYYDASQIKLEDFAKAGQDVVSINGTTYAFPLDIHPLTMFYNKSLITTAPQTYADIIEINAQMQENGNYAMGIPGAGLVEWYMMFIAMQNNIALSNGEYLNFETEEFANVLLQLNEMIYADNVSPANLGLDGEFKTFMQESEDANAAQTAFALTGPWFYTAAKEKYGDDLGLAPVPVVGDEFASYGGAHTIAISPQVEEQAKKDGIAEFLKFMYTPENLINWADSGQAPLHKATMELVKAEPEKYELAIVNFEQFENCKIAPAVYNVREQFKYVTENVYSKVVTTPNITKDEIMQELKIATQMAKEVFEEK